MNKRLVLLALTTLVLAACSTPQRKVATRTTPAPIENRTTPVAPQSGGGYLAGDGPGADIPANINDIPDAVPKSEPLHRYANRPYVALGRTYTPQTVPGHFRERGIASWYGKKFHGQRTSNGDTYDMYGMTAAHPTLPVPSYARVTNVATQKSVVVRINDRGPFLHDRVIDLSYTAAHRIGVIGNGSAEVEIESLAPNANVTTLVRAEPVQVQPLEAAEPPKPAPIATSTIGGNVFLQLGAFRSRDAATSFLEKMRAELGDAGKQVTLFVKDGLTRVHLGPYASQGEARSNAESLQERLGFKPMLNLH